MSLPKRVALKVDCDTYEGTKVGIPNLLRLFEKVGIKASFFFTLGPDRSGQAIRRIFTHKGFLRKMLRSNAVSMYGPKTMLYGTLLPAPSIGEKCANEIKSVQMAGHEVGVHGWDHVYWHDRLDKLSESKVEKEVSQAHDVFLKIFNMKAHSVAAPGWHSSPISLKVHESYKFLYTSNTRLGPHHFPLVEGTRFNTLEIPTTLPTLDEVLADPVYSDRARMMDFYQQSIQGTEIHTIHTEVEGGAYLEFFESLLKKWVSMGVEFLTLEKIANECLAKKSIIPFRNHIRTTLPNRGGLVSSSEPAESEGVRA